MSEIIILLVFMFFAVIGASTLTARLWLTLVRPSKRESTFTVSYLRSGEAEEDFLYLFEKYRWYGKEYTDYLIFICETQPCEKIAAFTQAHSNIICCKENQVDEIIKKIREDEDERKHFADRKA